MYRIGELSQQTGVIRETIRYYERLYTQDDVERLRFIQRARSLDFTLDDIAEILAFRDRNEPPCSFVLDVMQDQIQVIEQRIQNLITLRDELNMLHEAGQKLPEDSKMEACVCHLIKQHKTD